jgi:RHS repeat-associated protein
MNGRKLMISCLLWVVCFPVFAQRVTYVHTDALGSPVVLTDANRNVVERREYEPYGRQLTPAPQDGPGYTGHVYDAATSMVYMQQRYFDPFLGKFVSIDPVTADGSTGANFNRYWYANNNPYTLVDPDGRRPSGALCDKTPQRCEAVINISQSTAGGIGTTASSRRTTASSVEVPSEIRIESSGYKSSAEAARATGAAYGSEGVRTKRELEVGLIRIAKNNWGVLTPGWGPAGATRVDPSALLDAYVDAKLMPHVWMHGHFDSQLNFSATDFGLVFGQSRYTYLVNREGDVRVLRDSYLQRMFNRMPSFSKKNGLRGLQSYYPDGLPGEDP